MSLRSTRACLARARFSRRYFVAAVALLAIEAIIALFVHDDWVRPLLGDTLAIVWLYAVLKSAWPLPPVRTALILFAGCCVLEVGQYFHLVERLGLQHITAARVIIGTHYDPRDFLAYGVGACLIVLTRRALQP